MPRKAVTSTPVRTYMLWIKTQPDWRLVKSTEATALSAGGYHLTRLFHTRYTAGGSSSTPGREHIQDVFARDCIFLGELLRVHIASEGHVRSQGLVFVLRVVHGAVERARHHDVAGDKLRKL